MPLKKGGGREAYIPEKGMQEKAGQVFSGRWRGKNMAVEAHTLRDSVNFPSPTTCANMLKKYPDNKGKC